MTDTRHTLLLVDDEPEVLFSLKGLLRREFHLLTAESGAQALELLEQEHVDIVMTDQRMPEMTGVELMHRVKKTHPEAIRIIFTGYADIKAVIEAINRGGLFRYITKPWDPDELIQVLYEAAKEHDTILQQRQLLADLKNFLDDVTDAASESDGSPTLGQLADRSQPLKSQLQKLLPATEIPKES